MRFTVIWSPVTEGRLAELWNEFPGERGRITEAADGIDRLLRDDAQDRGEPYDGDRILSFPTLTVVYSVDVDDRIVKVIGVSLDNE